MENKGHRIHGNCIETSHFDYSVDNYMKSIDSIRELCGLPLDKSFDPCEVERFASMIMFLKEWKYFVYKPRSMVFQCETIGEVKDAFDEITIPQFSSAAVPKMDQSSNEAKNLCSDFVLHAGGLVWAMDWCPSNFESFDSEYKCEYLAISAHPPGSAYHKIGVPLIGRGIIQIWCLLTRKESVEISSLSQRIPNGKKRLGRPKGSKKKLRFCAEKSVETSSPIQKKPKEVNNEQYFSAEEKEDPSYYLFEKENLTAKKPIGRPTHSCKKQPLSSAINKNSEVSAGDLVLLNSDSSDANGNVEELISMCKEKYSAQTVLNPDDHIPVCENSLPTIAELSCNSKLNQPKQRGEPNKNPEPNANVHVQELGPGARNNEINSPIFADDDTFSEVIKLLKFRSKNSRKASKNKCFQTSVAQIDESLHVSAETFPITSAVQHEDTITLDFEDHSSSLQANTPAVTDCKMDSVLPTHIGHIPVCENSLPTIAELSCNSKLNQPKQRGEPNKKPEPNANVHVQELGPDARNNENNSPIFADDDTFSEVIKLLKFRSKNSRKASKNKCVQTSVAQIDESLHVSAETFPITSAVQHEDTITLEFEEYSSSLQANTPVVTGCKMDSVLPTYIGQPRKQRISSMKECVSISGSEVAGSTENQMVKNKCERGDACLVELCKDINNRLSENKRSLHTDKKFGICYSKKANGSTACRKKRRLEDKAQDSKASAITTVQTEDHCHSEMVLINARSNKTFHILKDTAFPKVVLCLAHNCKVAWDVKWRPVSIIKSEEKHSLGYLAALLGDGSLIVWEVPLPNVVNIIHTSRGTDETDPRFMRLQPVFKCTKVMRGDRQSIPLTMEWSTSAPHDLILAGCHDGTVAIWKFSKQSSTQDIKPLLCFSADNVPLRSLAWAPNESDVESANIIVTAGHEGIKFWDIRDPYRPLWEYCPIQKIILGLQWVQNPRCLVMSFDDGFIRILSLWRVANDFLATGEPFGTTKQIGLHSWPCSHFAIWNCQVSQATDIAAYCTADGYTRYFKLTTEAVEKDSSRYRALHYLSSSFVKDETTLKIGTPLSKVPVPNIPLKKMPSEMGDVPLYSHIEAVKQASGGRIERRKRSRSQQSSHQKHVSNKQAEGTTPIIDSKEEKSQNKYEELPPKKHEELPPKKYEELPPKKHEELPPKKYEELPPKEVAIHRLRWNLNKGSEKWLCSGGAAGVVRCQKIDYT